MKIIKLFFLVILYLLLIVILPKTAFAQNPKWNLKKDSMNLAILISDYQTYEFEKGHFSVHKPCDSCDIDSLAFEIIYNDPGDFGDIAFIYNETNKAIFSATIIWMGEGKILYPEYFLPSHYFQIVDTIVNHPLSIEYWDYSVYIKESILKQKADSAWNSVKYFNIVKDFAEYPYRVGIYLYPPRVGMFDPSFAKWIIFIYRGKVSQTEVYHFTSQPNKLSLLQNFPNPFTNSTTIKYNLKEPGIVRLNFYDNLGNNIKNIEKFQDAGEHQEIFEADNLSPGMYYYTIQIGQQIENVKLLLIK